MRCRQRCPSRRDHYFLRGASLQTGPSDSLNTFQSDGLGSAVFDSGAEGAPKGLATISPVGRRLRAARLGSVSPFDGFSTGGLGGACPGPSTATRIGFQALTYGVAGEAT